MGQRIGFLHIRIGYRYNADGLLVEALNEEGYITFTRDKTGRIV